MNAKRKFVDSGLFTTQIENPDFGIGDTTTKPRFWVGFVLTIAITSRWTTSHLEILREFKIRFDTGTTRAKRKLCWWLSVLPYIRIWWHYFGAKKLKFLYLLNSISCNFLYRLIFKGEIWLFNQICKAKIWILIKSLLLKLCFKTWQHWYFHFCFERLRDKNQILPKIEKSVARVISK